uniref:Uncharacterized protein n=1 Tax=mine drainage metagenome TaxID=410659 RepID=E6QBU0_9ZZZZ
MANAPPAPPCVPPLALALLFLPLPICPVFDNFYRSAENARNVIDKAPDGFNLIP